jgi:hypothetical protein
MATASGFARPRPRATFRSSRHSRVSRSSAPLSRPMPRRSTSSAKPPADPGRSGASRFWAARRSCSSACPLPSRGHLTASAWRFCEQGHAGAFVSADRGGGGRRAGTRTGGERPVRSVGFPVRAMASQLSARLVPRRPDDRDRGCQSTRRTRCVRGQPDWLASGDAVAQRGAERTQLAGCAIPRAHTLPQLGGQNQLFRLPYPAGQITRITNDPNDYVGASLSGAPRSRHNPPRCAHGRVVR